MASTSTRVVRSAVRKLLTIIAKRNDLSVQDYQMRPEGEGVELEVRRSVVEGENLHDTGEGRKEGFF